MGLNQRRQRVLIALLCQGDELRFVNLRLKHLLFTHVMDYTGSVNAGTTKARTR
ncbi:MAG: hypothetical protein R2851_21555 [Caldilineaceae bacterium]